MNEIRIKLVSREAVIGKSIRTPKDVIDVMQDLIGDMSSEYYVVAFLDNNNRPLSFMVSGIGTINQTAINPTNTLQGALLQNAVKMMLFHNHPTGQVDPTTQDIITTKKFIISAKLVGIEVLDHVILNGKTFFSFVQSGLMSVSDEEYVDSLNEMASETIDIFNRNYELKDQGAIYSTKMSQTDYIYWLSRLFNYVCLV